MRILLTGGTGFVGSALGARLVRDGHDLFCVSRTAALVKFGKTIVWDGSEPIEVARFPERIDAVIHLAQSRNFRHFPADAREMFAINVAMTMSLLDWSARCGIGQFCLISSGAVYEPFAGPLREDAALSPPGFLGASKLASEIIASPFSSAFALSTLRLFFPYGRGQCDRLIPELVRKVRSGLPVQIGGNGEGVRLVPTFIEDIVDVIVASVNSCWTGTFNVAAPKVLSIREIADAIGLQLGVEPKFEVTNGAAACITPDLSRLAGRYELTRFTGFSEGLSRTLS